MRSKLTDNQVVDLRQRAKEGTLLRVLAKEFKVAFSTVVKAVNGTTYKRAGGPIMPVDRRLTPTEVSGIRNAVAAGDFSVTNIAKDFNVSRQTVYQILNRETHKTVV